MASDDERMRGTLAELAVATQGAWCCGRGRMEPAPSYSQAGMGCPSQRLSGTSWEVTSLVTFLSFNAHGVSSEDRREDSQQATLKRLVSPNPVAGAGPFLDAQWILTLVWVLILVTKIPSASEKIALRKMHLREMKLVDPKCVLNLNNNYINILV